MKRFVLTALGFLLLQLFVAAFFARMHHADPDNYYAVVGLKEERLAQAPSPRVVVVGGSSVAFGLDSEILKTRLKRNPVNMGIHAALGFNFMLNEARAGLRKGDIVVLAPEYENFSGLTASNELLDLLANYRPASIRYVDGPTAAKLLDAALPFYGMQCRVDLFTKLTGKKVGERKANTYKKSSFNEYGDHISHRMLPNTYTFNRRGTDRAFGDSRGTARVVRQLNDFAQECRIKGIMPVYAFAPIPAERVQKLGSKIDKLQSVLSKSLKMEIVTSVAEATFPSNQFFDTDYHLGANAVRRRSEILARHISQYLQTHADP